MSHLNITDKLWGGKSSWGSFAQGLTPRWHQVHILCVSLPVSSWKHYEMHFISLFNAVALIFTLCNESISPDEDEKKKNGRNFLKLRKIQVFKLKEFTVYQTEWILKDQVKFLEPSLVQYDWCFYKERRLGRRQRRGVAKKGHSKKMPIWSQGETSGETKPADAWILAFQASRIVRKEISVV